jgi:hypothetical protein
VRIGGIDGLGSGQADLTPSANLSSLIFLPIANANWDAPENLNQIIIYGPEGAIIKAKTGSAKVTVNQDSIKLENDSCSIELTDEGDVKITGTLYINGTKYVDHKHSDVESGGSNSGPVVP